MENQETQANPSNVAPLMNRKERRAEKRLQVGAQGASPVEINLMNRVEATDADGTLIFNKDKELPTLREILLYSLRVPLQQDQQGGFQEKQQRYVLMKRIDCQEQVVLSQQDRAVLKERVGKVYLQIGIVGRVAELLEQAVPTGAGAEVSDPGDEDDGEGD